VSAEGSWDEIGNVAKRLLNRGCTGKAVLMVGVIKERRVTLRVRLLRVVRPGGEARAALALPRNIRAGAFVMPSRLSRVALC
jgi:hypothetical protein